MGAWSCQHFANETHGHTWPVFHDSETLMARPSRTLAVQFPYGYRRICRNHARSCVILVFWHFLAWGRISVGFLRHLGTEENRTRDFPYVFYAILSDVRWNIKWARRNFQAQPNEKVTTGQPSWVPIILRCFLSYLRFRHNVVWHCIFSTVNPTFKGKNYISHQFCVCSFKLY